ncbi:trimeric intracellular cation channel family protein [Cytobacillus firmus]|uniref:trimeric intracellular cation channel family protein n=1 Tax=Bacillaceae TaxID=186817 RepID=UPI0013D8AE17|nr:MULTISPECIES: trimeric intracellular cation channel family protein [Bacillaceae]MCC3648965.1 trimeric intracellular cation channel family protein [Cytobacillus oceanisediminis]MCS0655311.1 trimeric intracellular cation channel family protein [Cytobacillus firmus]MCU1808035.1 trimeric intracellular cation channel family protein [Cytobacillus firmus]NUH86231.1 trimeric intracellular cation channel family protein [Cytobacillus firmus]USK39555.1 trimeric intracellular cation channel family prot
MVWDVLNVIGTIAFAMSGAVVALEVKYDIMGAYVLGLITAFGGGAIRNLFTGIPIIELWQQTTLFIVALITISFVIILPSSAVQLLTKWSIFDSIGLSAFAVQGAMYAQSIDLPLFAVMFSAAITGAGGGMIRDVLAQRKPIVLRDEVYLLWAIFAGFIIGLDWLSKSYHFYILFAVTLMLRGISHHYSWRLPIKSIQKQ